MLEQLTVLAPGLLGGSVAQGARARGLAKRIVIWARRPEVRQALSEQPWCDKAVESLKDAAVGASLVVVAATVDAIAPLVYGVAPRLAPGTPITDVGSVKGRLCREAAGAARFGHGIFVGAHPMAGSEKTGWQNGSPDLFQDRTCFVTPLPQSDPAAIKTVADFWTGLGARVVRVDPDVHDAIVAHISHLPQVIASALCSFLASRDPGWRGFAGGGLRDTTRIAGSDPALWRTILQDNRDQVLAALRGFQGELAGAEKALASGDWDAVAALIARGRQYREGMK